MGDSGPPREAHGPATVRSQADVASELTRLRLSAHLTVRGVAKATGIPVGTLSGYFSGKHMPRAQDRLRLLEIVRACGATEPEEYAAWATAVERAYGLAIVGSGPDRSDGPPPPMTPPSLRPPIERLDREPPLRGRARLLTELADTVRGRAAPRVRVLHGLGGVGKSFTALYLARWARKRGYRVWWLPAGESVSATLGMRALALQLGVTPRQLDLGSPVDIAWDLLQALPGPWLLVIDNADDPVRDFLAGDGPVTDATGWLRPLQGRHGSIVITTRDGSAQCWGENPSWLRLHRLRPLGAPEAAHVLYELAGDAAGTFAEAASVADKLGGLPLALRLAGLHIREAREVPAGLAWPGLAGTFAAYERALESGGHLELLSTPGTDRHPRARIDQTWEISLDALAARGLKDARPLLHLLACFSNAQLPYAVLLAPEILAESPLFTDRMNGRSLWRLLTALAGLGLVEFERDVTGNRSAEGRDTLKLHPVLRAVCRQSSAVADGLDAYVALVMRLMGRETRSLYPSDPASWPHWSAVTVHSHSAIDLFLDVAAPGATVPPELFRPAMAAAQYLRASGRFAEAEAAYTVLLQRCETLFGREHPDVLAIRQGLCRVWYGAGRLQRAEEGLRALLADREAVLGAAHPETLATLHYLGRVRHDQGGHADAEDLFRSALKARRDVLGRRDPDTLASMENLADVWRARGWRLHEAERMMRIVLRSRRELFGDNYPATLITRQHLLELRLSRGIEPADEAEFHLLATDAARVFGPDHPRTHKAGVLYAQALTRLGHTAEAAALIRWFLIERAAALGPEHPHVLDAKAFLNDLTDGYQGPEATGP